MQALSINSVIQYISDDGEVRYERVLWLNVESDSLVVFELNNVKSLPVWKRLSDINNLLDNYQCKLVDYQSKRLAIREENISEKERNEIDRAWSIIKNLVESEPEIYITKSRAKLVKKAIKANSVYKNYVYRKLRAYWEYGKVKNALLPGNFNKGAKGKTRKSTCVKRGRPFKDSKCNNIGINITDDIKVIFKKAYKKFYNTTQKMSLQSAYYKMLEEYFRIEVATDAQGTKTVKVPDGEKLPSYAQFKYWYKKLNNIKDTITSRDGSIDFEMNQKAVLGESTSEAYGSGSMFQVDATIADIYLVSRDNRNWIIGRPVLYIIVDVFSRYIVGFYVGLEGPSWMGSMMALYNTVRNKVELCEEYGIKINESDWNCSNLTESLIVDRGELESTKPYNLINNLGINIKVLPPYKPNWKGIVEQSFRRLNSKSLHWLSGTVKREFRIRGEKDYRKDALLNLYEFTQIVIHSILYFNNTYMDYYIRGEDMKAEGIEAVPSLLWEWGKQHRSGLLRTFPEDIVKLNLMPYANASITYRGLQFKKLRYSCPEDIETGVYESARKYGNKAVEISYDPRNLQYVYVNEGLSYKKYTLVEGDASHLFLEEVEFNIEYDNSQKREKEPQKIANTVKLNSSVDEVVKKAKLDAKSQEALGKKRTKDIRENRRNEKLINRSFEGWEIGKQEKQDMANVKNADITYIPGPSYIDIIEDYD